PAHFERGTSVLRSVIAMATAVVGVGFAPMAAGQETSAFDKAGYIREAIGVIRERALYARRVDWDAVEAEALAREADARDDIDMLDTVVWLLSHLGDNHSFPQIARDRLAIYQERYNAMPWPP